MHDPEAPNEETAIVYHHLTTVPDSRRYFTAVLQERPTPLQRQQQLQALVLGGHHGAARHPAGSSAALYAALADCALQRVDWAWVAERLAQEAPPGEGQGIPTAG